MKRSFYGTVLALLLGAMVLEAGISQPATVVTSKRGKTKLIIKNLVMTPGLAAELARTNLLVILQSNAITQVVFGPCAMKGKPNKKTGIVPLWTYKLRDKATKLSAQVAYVTKKNKFTFCINRDTADDVVVSAPGCAAVSNALQTVPGGAFLMGASNEYFVGDSKESPVHAVNVSTFLIQSHEVSNGDMCRVLQWALSQGKVTASATTLQNSQGDPKTLINLANYACDIKFQDGVFYAMNGRDGFPCSVATWYGALAYANFLSEMEGLQPCINFTTWACVFTRNGYRLPTEAEWEKAARGGLVTNVFPWPSIGGAWQDHVDGSKANYYLSGGLFNFEVSPCGYFNGGQIPAGPDMANGYGLYDMAGNLDEWCWDWYKDTYYKDAGATAADTPGPVQDGSFHYKVVRGGRWGSQAHTLRCAARDDEGPTSSAFRGVGFRCVRRP
jgi:formylglycine-generating enzyme required for sulfatase activity